MIEGSSDAEKAAVLILGGPHSDGATLARCLSILGFRRANEEDAPPRDQAGEGREPDGVVRLNDRILADLGSAWDRHALFVLQGRRPLESAPRLEEFVRRQYLADAVEALSAAYGEARYIVADDPRMGLFPGLWDAALRERGFTPYPALVVSNPIEAAEALYLKHRLARPRGIQLWLRYMLAALAASPQSAIGLATLRERKAEAVFDLLRELQIADPAFAMQAASVDGFLRAALEHPPLPADVLSRRPLVSALVKDTYRLCLDWPAREPQARRDAVADLAARFEEFCLTASAFAHVPAAALAPAIPAAAPAPASPGLTSAQGGRCVVIHYHLFKNAGTSIDAILKRNFGERWVSREYERQSRREMTESVGALLRGTPEILALSSHTLHLPPPEIPGIEIFPVLFIRHPIDRLKSAYTFERAQQADTEGARLAKETDFAGYIRALLANAHDRVCRNFHTFRLAVGDAGGGSELERALRAFERLPFIGSVERFQDSIDELQRLLEPRFPGFQAFAAFENVSRPERKLDARIAEIRAEVGDELFERLIAENSDDFVLYRHALARYERETAAAPGGTRDGVQRVLEQPAGAR